MLFEALEDRSLMATDVGLDGLNNLLINDNTASTTTP
jgi:hypothetical protein